jgi:hypothetical protein
MLEYGRGVRKSSVDAALLYSKAAEQGHTEALYNLGVMHTYGRGVGKDYAKAAIVFEKVPLPPSLPPFLPPSLRPSVPPSLASRALSHTALCG